MNKTLDRRLDRRTFLAGAAALPLAAYLGGEQQEQPPQRVLLVFNKGEASCQFVDTATMRELGKTTTGRGPHEGAVTPDGRTAYACNYTDPEPSLSVISVAERRETGKIPLTPNTRPHGIDITRDGRTALVTCEGTQTVVEVDLQSQRITRTYNTDARTSHMVVLTPDERKAYVANIGSGSVTVLDRQAGTTAKQIPCAAGTEGIDVTPDGRWCWASNRAAHSISVIDTNTDEVVETLPCPGFPIRVKFTPDGRQALIASMRSNDIVVFDTATRREVRRHNVGGGAPIGLLLDPDGRRVYLAQPAANQVLALDVATLATQGSFASGSEPDGLALAPPR